VDVALGVEYRLEREKYYISKIKESGYVSLNCNAGGGGTPKNARTMCLHSHIEKSWKKEKEKTCY
jgi:hypothetical protein